jgi:penicillin-binding protein 1A
VPVRLAMKLTTTKIAATAKAYGVESEISLHKTMCLGISGMTVMDQATGYLPFATGGFAGERHAFSQILSGDGKVLWDFAKDGPKPTRVISQQALVSMNTMLAQIPEWGTGKRAAIPGMRVAGKTGTTQSYRDAWFVGFTGNYLAAVWYGNDDFTATEKMTGGTLPAMTWQRLMAYAHQNVELKPIPGLEKPFPDKVEPAVVAQDKSTTEKADAAAAAEIVRTRPTVLSAASQRILLKLRDDFEAAPKLIAPQSDLTVSAIGQ